MLVIDSSAIVAMMLDERGADALGQRLAAEPRGGRLMAAANYVEAGTVLAGRRRDPQQGVADLDAFLENCGITIAAIDEDLARAAIQVRIRFGKGFGASAGLNFGDCFAYALAKIHNAPLLFIGDDFGATDVTPAL
jgi:ribonuclease VapC